MRIAVVKPDHLGDQVLASPAVSALLMHSGHKAALYCGPGIVGLARYLYGPVQIHPMPLDHLRKSDGANGGTAGDFSTELKGYDLTVVLRNDHVMDALVYEIGTTAVMIRADNDRHETLLEREIVRPIVGEYKRADLFGFHGRRPLDGTGQNVGLCVSAGFATNRWPEVHWVELSRILASRGKTVWLIGGPQEAASLRIIGAAAEIAPERVIFGDPEFRFLDEVAGLDLVVASDGGTAHLCSLKVPVVSIFGSSPWRRYAPFGRWNRVVTRDMACSPCCQFDTRIVNMCTTRECMELIDPQVVANVVEQPVGRVGVERIGDHRIVTGTSHLELDE